MCMTMNSISTVIYNVTLLGCIVLLVVSDAAPPRGRWSRRDIKRAKRRMGDPSHLSGPEWHSEHRNVPAGLASVSSARPGSAPVRYRASQRSQIDANFGDAGPPGRVPPGSVRSPPVGTPPNPLIGSRADDVVQLSENEKEQIALVIIKLILKIMK